MADEEEGSPATPIDELLEDEDFLGLFRCMFDLTMIRGKMTDDFLQRMYTPKDNDD